MKKYSLILVVLLYLTACNDGFLDKNPLDKLSNETFWNNETDAIAAANGCYNSWWDIYYVLYFDCASDNAYNPYPWEGFQVQATGLASPSNTGSSFMGYGNITKCNSFLENIDRPVMDENLRKRLKAEVRFLRAWDYFIKVTLYGDVPLVEQLLNPAEANLPRTSKAEVVKFILDELNEVYQDLPESYAGSDVGRITQGAALALKARMEIFVGKYEDCINSCLKIMDLDYALFESYKGLYKIANENNQEVILDVQYAESLGTTWVLGVMPPNSSGGWSSINPTQALVDAYECVDGKTIDDPTSVYNPDSPYDNRDSRLAATIIYPGAYYGSNYLNSIDENDPNGDYYAPYGRSKTGYYPRKYIDDLNDYPNVWETGINGIVIRYAEVLLMYAESKTEINAIDATVYDALDAIRQRSGMPKVDRQVYNSVDKLRELIRRERRVELAMEGVRWFDICRWQIGNEVMNGMVYGARLGTVDPNDGTLNLTDERIEVETRIFDESKHYLWPIPQSVMDATPAMMPNNPKY
ncbi:RagB/SusD family nutrient uptake outer membrane protein [Carboxylicivirga mesophila]|uniref:RagB/SusD family nutrient uptake outer membrane protein n=1 Tax=Carboxylicivirga mesophila TaxID=1166478 RepID=A0ABS5KJ31_9BACT|nr:RagB/SusD family nutrient uptake outer membrane protein [Carboxylicivirga mesophila]MBS2213948.1 RagB/SusD family nutrient uptake outer membrane protein [Carboxylicivirga mesophila]